MTNIIELLHTTAAYQAAAVQLMIGQANFVAKELGLPDVVPTATNQLKFYAANSPALGVNGDIGTSNYTYNFEQGHLKSIHKVDWLQKISPPVTNLLALADWRSLIDTNGACELAAQWLAKLSIDVAELERKFPRHVFQIPARKTDANGINLPGTSNNVTTPLFLVSWGDKPPPFDMANPIRVKILWTTKELLELSIRDLSFFKNAPLQVTNAAELLGPLPSKREFMEKFFWDKTTYEIVAAPEKVEIGLLKQPSYENPAHKLRKGPAQLKAADAKLFSTVFTNFGSYQWGVMKMCLPDFGVKLKFSRNNSSVVILLCFDCDILDVTFNGKTKSENFDPTHGRLVNLVQKIFPNDSELKKLTKKEKSSSPFE